MYFGTISQKLAKRIKKETGVEIDISKYNCTLRADEIRKILLHSHGNEDVEKRKMQRIVAKEDIANVPNIITKPDKIEYAGIYQEKPAFRFYKEIDGKVVVVSYVSKKHFDLTVQTIYVKIKEKNLATEADAKSPA